MPLEIETLVLGPFETNCYVLHGLADCWVVDPGLDPKALLRFLRTGRLEPSRILLTHGHADHLAGVGEVKALCPQARLCCPAGDAAMLADAEANLSAPFGLPITTAEPDELLQPGQEIPLGALLWRVLDTGGHTPGGVSYYCPAQRVVLTGDALFARGVGRTDFPGADTQKLLANIRGNLLTLPGPTRVLPGHGPASTIAAERRENPFVGGAG